MFHVNQDRLRDELDTGRARHEMMLGYHRYRETVQGSAPFFLLDGTDVHNPGIEMHLVGEPGVGFFVVDSDDPSVYDDIVRTAAAQR